MSFEIEITIKSFEDGLSTFDFLIPTVGNAMRNLIDRLISLEEPPINVEGLNTIHFTNDYQQELFDFQQSIGQSAFTTKNKIAMGHAQVVVVKEGQGKPEDEGYHIFFSKLIPSAIVISQFLEDHPGKAKADFVKKLQAEKNSYIRMIRHELAHVEDENNQKKWSWLDNAFTGRTVQTTVRYDAFRLWEEYYACRRSNFIYNAEAAGNEVSSMLSDLETAEKEICKLRWKYNNYELEINDFIRLLHEYIRSAYIYCCYFMGHMDRIYEHIARQLRTDLYPSRFYSHMPDIWIELRKMVDTYPNWKGPEILDGLGNIVLHTIEDFEVYPTDTDQGIYYNIPPKKLNTRSEEARE